MKNHFSLIALMMIIMLIIPTCVKADVIHGVLPIKNEVVYREGQYIISISTIIEEDDVSTYATTGSKTVSKVYKIENIFGSVVATYTLKGKFSYDGTTATCTSATYSTMTESSLWSFEATTAYPSGAKAVGSSTAKTFLQTISDTITITCSKTGEIS